MVMMMMVMMMMVMMMMMIVMMMMMKDYQLGRWAPSSWANPQRIHINRVWFHITPMALMGALGVGNSLNGH
jgi:hypothetical protein